MDMAKEQHQICVNLGKSAMETLAMIRQAFREESMNCMLCSERTRKGETGKVQSKEYAHHFL
jgi:hypothetical protein